MGLVRTEAVKTTRRMRTYIAFGVTILIPIIMTIALKLNPPDQREAGGGGGLFFLTSQFSGLVELGGRTGRFVELNEHPFPPRLEEVGYRIRTPLPRE